MAKWRYSPGSDVAVELSADPEAILRGVLERLAPTVSRAMETAADQLEASARARWPVSKRKPQPNPVHSRELFESYVEVTPSQIRAVVRNTAKYAYYIKSSQNEIGGSGSAYVELIRKPAQVLGARLATDLAKELAEGAV